MNKGGKENSGALARIFVAVIAVYRWFVASK
jgi:hypothetical protein